MASHFKPEQEQAIGHLVPGAGIDTAGRAVRVGVEVIRQRRQCPENWQRHCI